MKGLALSENYYRLYGERMIAEHFSRYRSRIAVGLAGEGSECFGFDDEISRDHDWGPGFCIWLTDEDYEAIGHQLQNAYEKLPTVFQGFRRIIGHWGVGRVGVMTISAFYKKFIGLSHIPENADQWLAIPESHLAACTNGKIFTDPLGIFTEIRRKLFTDCPESVRLMKIAFHCMSAARAGQYNFKRSVQRGEMFAARFAETQFSADILLLVFLLNHRHAPFFKWRHRAARDLPILGAFIHNQIESLFATDNIRDKQDIIETICAEVIRELRGRGLTDSQSNFLLDHGLKIQTRWK
ncbi:MAG: DUF4037 domain-containing protein [Deltaproteobacteria bacterium]|nr:DUF4037 domain-containing protein [Deltaproteobacteria bacterium]